MSSKKSSSSLSTVSTDSYPKLYKSFSSNSGSISSISSEASNSSSSTSGDDGDSGALHPRKTTSNSSFTQRWKWEREAPITGRPYELKNFEIPFKPLPAYLSQLGGLGIPPRKAPCLPSKPDPFHKRTNVDEVFHKRVTDASTFSISEHAQKNNHTGGDRNSSSDESEDLADISWHAFQQRPNKDKVLKECKRTFFRARKELFKMRQHDDYQEEKNRLPEEVESWEISSDESSVSEYDLGPVPVILESIGEVKWKQDEFQPTEILREENKSPVQENERAYLELVREHMWKGYEKAELEQQSVQAEWAKSPEPIDEEEIVKNLPEQDFLNRQKQQFREDLAKRLEAIEDSQKRVAKKLPQTAIQFERYTDTLMKARRELRDEAILVDEHYKKAGLVVDIPEKDLQLRKYRAANHKSDDESERGDALDAEGEKPVVHTCMTRLEWARWIGRCTKLEKLKLPKVKIPRIPREIHKAAESPVKLFIQGRLEEEKPQEEASASVDKVRPKRKPKSVRWSMWDQMYEAPVEYRISEFVPYKAPVRPFTELAQDRFLEQQAYRRRRRELRKNHMNWISELVDEICAVD